MRANVGREAVSFAPTSSGCGHADYVGVTLAANCGSLRVLEVSSVMIAPNRRFRISPA